MLERLRSKAEAWLSQRAGDSTLPGDLTLAELEERIAELEVQRDEHREALESLERQYRTAAERAAVVDEVQLQDLRMELDMIIDRYAGRRQTWARTHVGVNFLRQLSLLDRREGLEGRFDVDREDLWMEASGTAPSGNEDLERWLEGIRDRGVGRRNSGVGETDLATV